MNIKEKIEERKEFLKCNKDILKEASNMPFDAAVNIIKKLYNNEEVDDIKINTAIYVIGKNKLKELGINYDIVYKEKIGDNKNDIGICSYPDKTIFLKLSYWKKNTKINIIEMLKVIFHEIGHAKQHEIDNYLTNFNYLIYYYCENKVLQYGVDVNKYYDENYYSDPCEFIAETFAFNELISFYSKYETDCLKIIKNKIAKNKYFKNFYKEEKIIGDSIENDFDLRIDKIMSNDKKRKVYLSYFPILKLKYNEDGTNNSLQEVIDKIDIELEKNPKLLSEYANFLKVKYKRVIYNIENMQIDNMANEIDTLFNRKIELLNIKSSNEKLNKAINIYKEKVFTIVFKRIREIKDYNQIKQILNINIIKDYIYKEKNKKVKSK